MGTRRTCVKIDQDLLAAAKHALATKTVEETVEKAFLEILRAQAKLEEVKALSTMSGMDLAEPEIMAGAWRG